ncbi:MAG TPA: glycosyltransferase, partial [Candidatus Aquilonibacter sp.]|nr:glycosyltransferase [Candidatus Aquilonibacter sp.]
PARICETIARALYHTAACTIAVTPTALRQIQSRGLPAERVLLAPNAASTHTPSEITYTPRSEFVAMYAGNLGLATDVDVLAEVAALVAPDGITLELVGDGAERARLERRAGAERLSNLRFRGTMPRDDAMRALAGASVALIPLRAGIQESVPTKIYDALSLGVPAIVAANGEAERIARELGAAHVPAGDAAAIAQTLRAFARLDPSERRAIGERGRNAVRQRADRAGIMTSVAARVSALS